MNTKSLLTIRYTIFSTITWGLLLSSGVGCMDGPMYALKRVNPYYTSQWQADREHGPTFDDRFNELVYLKDRMPDMDAAKQAQWAKTLAGIVNSDPSAEMRARAIRVLAPLQLPEVTLALNKASADDVMKVRMAACEAWQIHGGPDAQAMLLTLAKREDEDTSVRRAAIASLASFPQANVQRSLGNMIDDASPAIQFQVAQSLSTMTGKEFGGDIPAWKQYLAQTLPTESAAPGAFDALPTGPLQTIPASHTSIPQFPQQ